MRCFENDDITHVSGKVNPLHDIEIIDTELMLADLDTVQKMYQRAEKAAKAGDKPAVARRDGLKKLLDALENGKPARSVVLDEREAAELRDLHLITAKPVMYVANVAEDSPENDNALLAPVRELAAAQGSEFVVISAALEAELAQLEESERAEFLTSLGLTEPGLNRVIRSAYRLLGLKTFYTAGPKEVPRVDRAARRDGAASRGRDSHRLRTRLHSCGSDRLRRVHQAARRERRTRGGRAQARGQDLRRAGRRRGSFQVQRLGDPFREIRRKRAYKQTVSIRFSADGRRKLVPAPRAKYVPARQADDVRRLQGRIAVNKSNLGRWHRHLKNKVVWQIFIGFALVSPFVHGLGETSGGTPVNQLIQIASTM